MPAQVSGGLGTILNHLIVTTPTAIAQVVSITPPPNEMGVADTVNLASVIATERATLVKIGDLGFKIQYDPGDATHKLITTKMAAKTIELWNIVFADEAPTTIPFSGFVKSFAIGEITAEGNLEADITISVQSITWPT